MLREFCLINSFIESGVKFKIAGEKTGCSLNLGNFFHLLIGVRSQLRRVPFQQRGLDSEATTGPSDISSAATGPAVASMYAVLPDLGPLAFQLLI